MMLKRVLLRETIDKFIRDVDVGVGLTDVVTSTGGTSHDFQYKN